MRIRLTCRIPKEAENDLRRLCIHHGLGKGKTAMLLMETVRNDHAYVAAPDANNGREESCTLNVPDEWIASFKNYRKIYLLDNNTIFFRACLLHGIFVGRAVLDGE